MRRFIVFAVLFFTLVAAPAIARAQGEMFTRANLDYALELPSPAWRAIISSEGTNQSSEFVYNDRMDGYLRVRRETVDAGLTTQALAARDQDNRLRFLPGFVQGQTNNFAGRLRGTLMTYEYTTGGRAMSGLVYYLQADNRTIYSLHFTGTSDRLRRIRNQTDNIARSFHLK
jgi:hypothetical protein